MINVLVVENDPMARKLLEIYIKSSEKYNLISSIESAAFAEAYCTKYKIDLILMDVCTALGASGLDVSAKIKKNYPDIKILIITRQPEISFIERARESKIESFWYKNSNEEEILEIMEKTVNGESVYPDNLPNFDLGMSKINEFTNREIDILRGLIDGATNEEIGEKLNISKRTVGFHIQNLLDKTGFHSRTELAVTASKSGLINNDY